MTQTSARTDGFVKLPRLRGGETLPQIGETNFRVINKIKEMYENPAMIFGRWIGTSDKTAKRKLNFARTLDVEELGKLIRSERGFEVVTAVMGEAKPEWWRIVVPLMDAADIQKMQRAARRRIAKALEGALDADRNLTEAIQRTEALAVQDEDHIRPYRDALRSMAGVSNRTMAPSKGRGR